MAWPLFMYGSDCPELELVEVGKRAATAYDEPTSIEHRLANANGLSYGCPPRHWTWELARRVPGSDRSNND